VVRLLAVAVICAAVASDAQPPLSKADATKFQAKLVQIEANAARPKKPKPPARSTAVSDAEVNAYLKYLAGSQVPVGVVDPCSTARGTAA